MYVEGQTQQVLFKTDVLNYREVINHLRLLKSLQMLKSWALVPMPSQSCSFGIDHTTPLTCHFFLLSMHPVHVVRTMGLVFGAVIT